MESKDYGPMPTPPQDHGTGERPDPLAGHSIIIDTKEKRPLVFPGEIRAVRRHLDTGDYSISGYEDRFTVERKSLADLVGTVTHDRKRFVCELERMTAFEFRRILIVAPFAAVARGRFRIGRGVHSFNPRAVLGSLMAFDIRYGVPVEFASGPGEAAERVALWARYFVREREGQHRAAPDPGTAGPQERPAIVHRA